MHVMFVHLDSIRVRFESRYWPNSHDAPISWPTAGWWVAAFFDNRSGGGRPGVGGCPTTRAAMSWTGLTA